MLVVSEFWFFKNEISLLKIIQGLFENNELVLATVVTTFGVVLPTFRMIGQLLNQCKTCISLKVVTPLAGAIPA